MAAVTLSPGPLFRPAGHNTTHTPVGPNADSKDVQKQFPRKSTPDELGWPRESPPAGIYDVSNSSVKLLRINSAKPRETKLRGLSDVTRASKTPDPERHVGNVGYYSNQKRHGECHSSQSARFTPSPPVSTAWVNSTQRPAWTPRPHSPVNNERHRACSSPVHEERRARSAPLSSRVGRSRGHPHAGTMMDMSKIYSIERLKQLKEESYIKLLRKRQHLGFNTKEECDKYRRYLNGPRKKQFGREEQLKPCLDQTSSHETSQPKRNLKFGAKESSTTSSDSNNRKPTRKKRIRNSKSHPAKSAEKQPTKVKYSPWYTPQRDKSDAPPEICPANRLIIGDDAIIANPSGGIAVAGVPVPRKTNKSRAREHAVQQELLEWKNKEALRKSPRRSPYLPQWYQNRVSTNEPTKRTPEATESSNQNENDNSKALPQRDEEANNSTARNDADERQQESDVVVTNEENKSPNDVNATSVEEDYSDVDNISNERNLAEKTTVIATDDVTNHNADDNQKSISNCSDDVAKADDQDNMENDEQPSQTTEVIEEGDDQKPKQLQRRLGIRKRQKDESEVEDRDATTAETARSESILEQVIKASDEDNQQLEDDRDHGEEGKDDGHFGVEEQPTDTESYQENHVENQSREQAENEGTRISNANSDDVDNQPNADNHDDSHQKPETPTPSNSYVTEHSNTNNGSQTTLDKQSSNETETNTNMPLVSDASKTQDGGYVVNTNTTIPPEPNFAQDDHKEKIPPQNVEEFLDENDATSLEDSENPEVRTSGEGITRPKSRAGRKEQVPERKEEEHKTDETMPAHAM